jgi:excisionase family DNA binding protein
VCQEAGQTFEGGAIMTNGNSDSASSILTIQDIAKYLRVHPATIYRLLKKKQLPAFKVGRDWRFSRESIDRWRADAEANDSK